MRRGDGVWLLARRKKNDDRVPNAVPREGKPKLAPLPFKNYGDKKRGVFGRFPPVERVRVIVVFRGERADKPRQDPDNYINGGGLHGPANTNVAEDSLC